MPRRRNSGSEGGVSLDSLMDALTNVVAVLILVLILVQADVSQKVAEFLENMKPATAEEVAESKRELERIQESLGQRRILMTKDASTPAELEKERRQLALLEKTAKDDSELLADLEQLRKLEEKLRKERDAEQAKTQKVQAVLLFSSKWKTHVMVVTL